MKFKVHMLAFGRDDEVREVEIPDSQIIGLLVKNQGTLEGLLGLVFHNGQNDFQPQQHPSVSVGDVIELDGRGFFLVQACGFSRLGPEALQAYRDTPRRDRSFGTWGESLYG